MPTLRKLQEWRYESRWQQYESRWRQYETKAMDCDGSIDLFDILLNRCRRHDNKRDTTQHGDACADVLGDWNPARGLWSPSLYVWGEFFSNFLLAGISFGNVFIYLFLPCPIVDIRHGQQECVGRSANRARSV